MKVFAKIVLMVMVVAMSSACVKNENISSIAEINWKAKEVKGEALRTLAHLELRSTYLSVYPQVFNVEESQTQALTVTVSMRNTSMTDTIYITSARYYNTQGQLIRKYFDYPIHLLPLETDHIIINHNDNKGGTGANFIFEWAIDGGTSAPIFEAVMLSTFSQQGISFTTQGVNL